MSAELKDRVAAKASADQAATDARLLCDSLTPRQREVLILACKGFKSDEIGAMLGIALKTVSAHREAVLSVFEAKTGMEAAVIAAKAGIV